MYKINEMTIPVDGAKLRHLRRQHGYTQDVLAEMVGLSREHLGDLERSTDNNMLLVNAMKLSIALDVDINDLVVVSYKKAE